MKHKLSKLTSLFLAVAMALAMAFTAVPAKAADTSSLKVTNSGKTAHTFEIYQIFTGKATDATPAGTGKLSDVQWGNGITDAGKTALYTKYSLTENDQTAAKVAEALATANDADAFAAAIGTNNLQNPTTSDEVAAGGNYTFSNLASGYYLVIDKAQSQDGKVDGAYTRYIVAVAGAAEMNTKLDVPTVVKQVKDTNDSTANSTTGWQDSADYDIGDDVPYQITGTLPTNYDKYTTYAYTFTDKMSKGLTYTANTAKITINTADGTDITNKFTETVTKNSDGTTTVTWACTDLKAAGVTATDKVIVTYTANLNSDAVIGSAGNPNTVGLTYSNNPNGEGTGKTKEDKNKVFTYKVIVNKVDKDNNALEGAEFTLVKKLANNTEKTIDVIHFKKDAEGNLVAVSDNTGRTATTFEFDGLDDGTYVLKETKTPDGYNTIPDQTFTVTATHDTTSDDPTLTDLTGNVTDGTITFTKDVTAGSLTSDVVNNSGSTLPSTGGIGTTIFYVVGGILVAGAAILLITRRRTER